MAVFNRGTFEPYNCPITGRRVSTPAEQRAILREHNAHDVREFDYARKERQKNELKHQYQLTINKLGRAKTEAEFNQLKEQKRRLEYLLAK